MSVTVQLPKTSWLYGGCVFYLLSAACVLVGILKLVTPVYDDPAMIYEKLYALAALHVYELALLSVALMLVLWRRVVDDAVSLVVLIAAFMVGSATALDSIAPDLPRVTAWFGGAGLALAAGKIAAMHSLMIGRFRRACLLALGALLAWNFAMPAIMGAAQAAEYTNHQLLSFWAAGWCFALLAGMVLIGAAVRREPPTGPGTPLLYTPAMRWLVAAIILAATFAHQYALAWTFGLRIGLGDFLPAPAMLCLLGVAVRHALGRTVSRADAALLALPLVLTVIVLVTDQFAAGLAASLLVVSYPPVVLLAMACACAALAACRAGSRLLSVFACVYLILGAGFLNADLTPGRPDWSILLVTTATVLLIGAIVLNNLVYLFACGAVLASILTVDAVLAGGIEARGMRPWVVAAAVLGVHMLCVHIVFVRRVPDAVASAGGLMLVAAVMHCCFREASAWHAVWLPTLVVTAGLMAVAWRARDPWLLVPAGPMLVVAAYTGVAWHAGWLWVGGSFLLLAAGAAVSLMRGRGAVWPDDGSALLHPPDEPGV